MKLTQLLRPQDVLLFQPSDKWDAIQALTKHASAVGRLSEDLLDQAREAVNARERSMSTGMEHGIAIPHAALEQVTEVGAVMGIVTAEEGLPFESIDGSPAELIVLLLIPRKQKILHIRTLADVARGLSPEFVRRALRQAPTAQEAWEVLAHQDA